MIKLIIISAFAVLMTACHKTDSTCEGVMCTMEVRSVGMVLKNGQAIPPVIDYVETWRKDKLVHTDTGYLDGNYWKVTLLSDGNRPQLSLNQPDTLSVRVIKQGAVLRETELVILSDCCHVNKIAGLDTLMVP